MFYIQLFLGQHIDCALFLQRVEKQEVRVPHKTKTLTELNKKEIIKEAQRDLFLFTDQLYQNSITNAISYSPSCNISVCSFSSETHHFLSYSQLFCATIPLFIVNSFITIHFFSYIFLTAKASFLHCNSYAFTL